MDGTLPSYEAAMREARAYLRRRDLSSQDEIPLYFAWQRLYAAANANLSTDFMQETKAELRARQEARLAPRRGIPPPLFTSFDKVHRTSAQASAYLRSRTSSDVAIEMMARRYRREAEKLRSSREKLMSPLYNAERRMKSKRRQKSAEIEVDELLESIGHPGIDYEDNDRLSGKSTVNKLAGTSSDAVNRMKKTKQHFQISEDDDQLSLSDDQRGNFARKSKARKSGTKGELGGADSKDDFRNDFEIDGDPAKAAELRRSSLSTQNPATIPSYSTVANVAAFAAQVSDWRMPPDIDNAPRSPELSQKDVASYTTARGKRLSGANELRESVLVDGEEGDVTLNSSLGSSNLEEDELDHDMDTGNSSPTHRRSTRRNEVEKNKATSSRDKQGTNGDIRPDRPGGFADTPSSTINADSTLVNNKNIAARGSEFHQKLMQLSHAVGDMQVKIQGKQIEVTFKGALDNETESERNDTAVESSIKSSKTKWTSADQKVLNTAGNTSQESDKAKTAQGNLQSADKQDQNNAKNARVGTSSGGDDNNRKDQRLGDHQLNKNESDQQEVRGTSSSAAISPAIYEGQPRQIQSSSSQRESATRKTSAQTFVHGEDDSETNDVGHPRQQHRFSKSQRESDQAETEVVQRVAQPREQDQKNAQGVSAQRKQGGVRFADTASSHGNDNYNEEQHSSDQKSNRYKSDQQQMRSGSASSAPSTYKGQPRQIRSSITPENISTTMLSAAESVENDDSETKGAVPPREQHRFTKSQQKETNDEAMPKHNGEEPLDEGDFRAGVDPSSTSVDFVEDPMNENKERLSEYQENRRSSSERDHEQLRPPKNTLHDLSNGSQDTLDDTKSDRRQERSHHRSHSSGHDPMQEITTIDENTQTLAARGDKNDSLERDQSMATRDNRTHSSGNMPAKHDRTEASGRGQHGAARDDKTNSSGRGQTMEARDTSTNSSKLNKDLSARGVRIDSLVRGQNVSARGDRADENNKDSDNSKESILIDSQSRKTLDNRQIHGDSAIYERYSTTTKQESNTSPARNDIDYEPQSFSDASEDDKDDDQDVNSIDESVVSKANSSSRVSKQKEQTPQKSGEMSSLEHGIEDTPVTQGYERKRQPSSRLSREQPILNDLDSDDEFSDGPDTPNVKQHLRKYSERKLSRISGKTHEAKAQTHSKRFASRSNSTRHYEKRSSSSYLIDSVSDDDSSDESLSDDDSRYEDESSHTRHRSRKTDRAHSRRSTRHLEYQPQSKEYSRERSSRDLYFSPSLDLPPKKITPVTRPEHNSKTRSESRSKGVTKKPYKLPEGIVWPPGMEEECIARLGLDGHHPIAPPGLEHLVTEEQWGDYWTWLHWYSSWQMWYMKNGKKPKRKSNKAKRSGRRHADVDEFPDIEAEHYSKHGSRNANWWVDVGSNKNQHRHHRDRYIE